MLFLNKTIYYCLFVFCVIFTLFLMLNFIDDLFDLPYARTSEIIIFMLAMMMMISGIFLSRRIIRKAPSFLKASFVLGLTFLLTLIEILTGLFCFNGPVHWQ